MRFGIWMAVRIFEKFVLSREVVLISAIFIGYSLKLASGPPAGPLSELLDGPSAGPPRLNTNRLTCGRTTPFRSACGINGACCLLNFDCCSGFRKFLLDRFSFVFAYAFFDGFWCAFDKIFRFL